MGGAGQPELLHLPVEAIHPNPRQPRRRFEPEATSGLAASIRRQGLLQPVVVRPRAEGGYQLVAGERRWRAAREAGVPTLPALVRAVDDRDSLLLGLVENVARENLSPVEEARAYASLLDEFELSLGEVAEQVGRSKASVSNRVRLLDLPEEVLWMLARGELTEGHARAVLALPDDGARKRLAKRIATEYYGTRVSHAYWNSCSNGGRQGLIEAQRYPDDFDGIVAGAPAANWTGRALGSRRVGIQFPRNENCARAGDNRDHLDSSACDGS